MSQVFPNLSSEQWEALQYLVNADPARQQELLKLFKKDYREQPVDPEQFLFDKDYLGHVGSILWPAWKDKLLYVMDPSNGVIELILTGAIGIGKTSIALCVMAYRIYHLLCLQDPYEFYGQARINRFYFGLYNVYKYKGREMYDKLKAAINFSPWFQRNFPVNPRKKDEMEFPEVLSVIPGSSEIDALGENLVACHLSEVNFMRVGASEEEKGQAWRIYENAWRRIKSRFMYRGVTPGILILDSSRRSHTDMLEEHLKEVAGDSQVVVYEGALWDFKPSSHFTGRTFWVSIGNQVKSSEILGPGETSPKGTKVIEVPEEFRKDFEKDIDGSLRDIGGVATYGIHLYFPNPELLIAAEDDVCEHPFTQPVISISTRTPYEIVEYLDREKLVTITRGRYSPRNAPGHLRFIHTDLSRTGCSTGLAMGYVEGVRHSRVYADDIDAVEWFPVIRIEMMLEIVPPARGEIDFAKLRRFYAALRDMGFEFGGLTFDGFQSADMVQILTRAGYPASVISMDRAPCVSYQMLRAAVTESRIRWYHYPTFHREVTQLQRNVIKEVVEKPKNGSKDVADAVAGVVFQCSTSKAATGEPEQFPHPHEVTSDMLPIRGVPEGVEAPFRVDQLLGKGYKG